MCQNRVFDFLMTEAVIIYTRKDTGGGVGAVSNTRPHSGLDYVCSGRGGQRSEEETEKANGNLWRCVV
jgi:hypothetical protein